jgi:hypothetical protein
MRVVVAAVGGVVVNMSTVLVVLVEVEVEVPEGGVRRKLRVRMVQQTQAVVVEEEIRIMVVEVARE